MIKSKRRMWVLGALAILIMLGTNFLIHKRVTAAEKMEQHYMVLYIYVDDGSVHEVFQANALPEATPTSGNYKADLKLAEPVDHKKGGPFNINNFISDKAIATLYATSSPGCRYVHKSNCRYVKVCK